MESNNKITTKKKEQSRPRKPEYILESEGKSRMDKENRNHLAIGAALQFTVNQNSVVEALESVYKKLPKTFCF
jgi:hypothetical protein